ncbi:Phosphatidylinositol-4-phosphate 5-kinase [Curvularia kusanoi]|uniref:Phosphatidylinositol-4-phosphate 5-kinase n=1 Tax=Curvularia kusanoi TaxID=90978 RepID=A0A9P4T529_CURKU|nr:Phosphatidylinositol-4-phosphate 5-kinase [Curvularia kusanoi]
MASVMQQLQKQKDPLHVLVTPGALIEQTKAGSTSQTFTNDSFAITDNGLQIQTETDQSPVTMRNGIERSIFEQPVKNEADSQTVFENAVKQKLNIPNGYEKVAVLVVRWDDELEDPRLKEGHDEEVKRLKQVLGERFHFDVSSEVRLNTTKKPQIILNKAIMDHIDSFDGANNLLIIYYTGHGSLLRVGDADQQLQLAATNNSHRNSKGPHPATAIWCQAERPLMEVAEADVLSLLDCCYAGSAHKGVGGERRTYELLAACHKGQKTRGPGPNSFTTRLLNALEQLLVDPKEPPIIMTRLQNNINTRDPQGLTPVMLLDRLDNHVGRHLQLAPVQERTKEKNEQFQQRPNEKSVVKLRFSLEVEELSQNQIEDWAHELSKLCQSPAKIPIRRIDWMKVENRKGMTQRWKDALDFAQKQSKKRKSVPDGSSSDDRSPLVKRRTQDDLLSPRDTQGQLPPTPGNSE